MEHQQGALPLTIGGKARTLFFDYTFVSLLQANTGAKFEQITEKEPMRTIPIIALAALQAGDDVNELPEALTERQVSRWLSALSPADNAKILDCYRESMGFIGAVFNGVAKIANAVAPTSNTGF